MKSITYFWNESQTPHFIPESFAIDKGVAYRVVNVSTASHFKLFLIRVGKEQEFVKKRAGASSVITSAGCVSC